MSTESEFSRGMYIYIEAILLMELTSLYDRFPTQQSVTQQTTTCDYLHTDSPVPLTELYFPTLHSESMEIDTDI